VEKATRCNVSLVNVVFLEDDGALPQPAAKGNCSVKAPVTVPVGGAAMSGRKRGADCHLILT
jgi:hypothetical protein